MRPTGAYILASLHVVPSACGFCPTVHLEATGVPFSVFLSPILSNHRFVHTPVPFHFLLWFKYSRTYSLAFSYGLDSV